MNEPFDAREYLLSGPPDETFYAYVPRDDGTPVWLRPDGSVNLNLTPVPFTVDEMKIAYDNPNWRFVKWTRDPEVTTLGEAEEDFDPREYLLAPDRQAQLEQRGFKHVDYPVGAYARLTKNYPADVSLTAEPVEGEVTLTAHQSAYLLGIWHLKDGQPWKVLDDLDAALKDEESASAWAKEMQRPNGRVESVVDGLLDADDFDPREYFLSNDTNTDAIAEKLVTEFGFREGPRRKRGAYKNVRSFWTRDDTATMKSWRGQLSLTRTYIGDENNQTWAVDWYPYNVRNVAAGVGGEPGHIHTSGPQNRLLDFLKSLQSAAQTEWMTNTQAIKQSAIDAGFDTTYIDRPMESVEEPFDAREYVLAGGSDIDDVLVERGFKMEQGLGYHYERFFGPIHIECRLQPAMDETVRVSVGETQPGGEAFFSHYTVPYADLAKVLDMFIPVAEELQSAVWTYDEKLNYWEFSVGNLTKYQGFQEAVEEPFDAREYLLAPDQGEYELRKWITDSPATMATVLKPGEDEYFLDVRRQDGKSQRFGPFRRDQIRLFNREWHGFKYAGWAAGPSVTDRDKLFSIFDSEDFDPRDYLLSAPADYVVKWTFGPPKPEQRLYRYTRINGQTSEESALREWQVKMDRDWGWRVGDDKKPQMVKVVRAAIQDRPVQEADDFDAREYFTSTVNVMGMLKSMRYEISPDGAAKVFKGANDRDYMLFVTLRGGQSLDTAIATSIYDLGIFVGKGRDWENLKYLYAMTPDDIHDTLEQAEKAIRQGDWTGLGLSINRVNDSVEPPADDFDPRSYFLDATATFAVLDTLGFKKLPKQIGTSDKQVWQRIQGSIRIDVERFDDDDHGTFVVGYVSDEPGKWVQKEVDIPNRPRSLEQVIDDVDAVCRGVYEGLEQPPADDFDAREYFIDSSNVQFNLNGKREAWNFGAESSKDIELFNGAATLRLKYLADEWHPRWTFEVHANVPWQGQFDKLLVKRTSETERLLPKRIEQVLAAATKWYEQNKWGITLYPLIYGPNGVKDWVGEQPDWAEYVEQNAGDLPTEFEKQTEESAAGWKELIFKFRAERGFGVRESEDFDAREYLLADKGPSLVARLKELGYKQVQLHVMTDRHAVLAMNDPKPEYDEDDNIDDTQRRYARNRVVTAVREIMGLATNVYDFSGDGGYDYLYKICDPEQMGVQGRFEAEDNFDPRDYLMGMMPNEGVWRVIWVDKEGTTYHTKQFDGPEKAMRYAYTTSLWNKAEDIKLERKTGVDLAAEWKEFVVTRDYELIDPDTGNVLIRESLVMESEQQDFSARDYVLAPDEDIGRQFMEWLVDIGFDPRGENTFELNQWGTRYVVQRYKNGKYRYAVYDENGHKMRGQMTTADQLVTLLQQHLHMKLREGEENFDPREYMLSKTTDDAVFQWLMHSGFKEAEYPGGVPPKFYAVWEKTIGPYQLAAYRGVYDEKLGSHRWWVEVWDHGRHNGNMGAYFSAENFLPRIQAQVRMKTDWAEHEQSTAANA